jgi:hypothetical protein
VKLLPLCNCLQPGAKEGLGRLKQTMAEKVYKSTKTEPIGKSLSRGHNMPAKTTAKVSAAQCKNTCTVCCCLCCCQVCCRTAVALASVVQEHATATVPRCSCLYS